MLSTICLLFGLTCGGTTPAKVAEPTTTAQRIYVAAITNNVDPSLATKIAKCESDLKQFNKDGTIKRGEKNSHDVGVFQINEDYHLQDSLKMGIDIYSEKGNIDYAIVVMKNEGFKPWNWSRDCWDKDNVL